MSDNNRSLLVGTRLRVDAIFRPDGQNESGQVLEHVGGRVLIQTVRTAITRQIDRNDRRPLLKGRRAENVPPDGPTIGKTVDENHQWLIVRRSLRQVVADVVELESVAQGEDLMVQTGCGLREVPEAIASCNWKRK